MTPGAIFATLLARWRLISAVTLLVLAIGAAWAILAPRTYTATASLLFDNFQPDPVTDSKVAPQTVANFLGTQADIIASRKTAARVVESLGLAQDANLRAAWEEGGARGEFGQWLGGLLLSRLTVTPAKDTNVVQITYASPDPRFAAILANGFAQAFIETQLALKVQPARGYSDWFRDRVTEQRDRLQRAQKRLTEHQQAAGLIGAEKLDVEVARVGDLSAQLVQAQSASADAGARARSGAAGSPEVLASGTVQGLRSQIALKSAEVQRLAATLGSAHPEMQTARAELAALQAKLGEETGRAAGSLSVAASAAQSREAQIAALLDQQRQRVLKLSGEQDRLSVLQRDVDLAKQAYEAVTQRQSNATLLSEVSQTNATLLDAAKVPSRPASPNVPLTLFLSLMLGLLAGIGIALGLEVLQPRIRTAETLRRASGVPVLADLRGGIA